MKKVYVLLLMQLLVFESACYGAVSDDVYVRRDVFDAKMEALFNRLHAEITEVRGDIKALSERIDGLDAKLLGRIDGLDAKLSGRIDGLDKRIDDLRNGMYLWLVVIGTILTLPSVQKMFEKWSEKKAKKDTFQMPFTLDDVRRLIEENNVKVLGKPQV